MVTVPYRPPVYLTSFFDNGRIETVPFGDIVLQLFEIENNF